MKYLLTEGENPVALNFASATTPGSGFLTGARAQEEYLARSSGLWSFLHQNPMYSYRQDRLDHFYADFVIYSPDVPIVRDDNSDLFGRTLLLLNYHPPGSLCTWFSELYV